MQPLRCSKRRRYEQAAQTDDGPSRAEADARVDAAVLQLRVALRDLVHSRPTVERELIRADIDIIEDRRAAADGITQQGEFIKRWHSWAANRLLLGGGYEV